MAQKINSRNKGNRFERDIAKWFETWSGYEFGRVPGSGSLRWKKTDNITGDITCTDPKHARRFPFSVECKFYAELKFEHILLGNKSSKINKFWTQCLEDAERANKVPLLFMRYNQMPKDEYFIMTTSELATNKRIKDANFQRYMKLSIEGKEVVILMASELVRTEYINYYKAARAIIKRV